MSWPLSNIQVRDAEALLQPDTGYIGGLAGLWCCGLGFGNGELVEAALDATEARADGHLVRARRRRAP